MTSQKEGLHKEVIDGNKYYYFVDRERFDAGASSSSHGKTFEHAAQAYRLQMIHSAAR